MKKYCPGNGTEGCMFMSEYCDVCLKDMKYRRTLDGDDGCKILIDAMMYDKSDEEYPKEWTYDKDDSPTCTAFIHEKDRQKRREYDLETNKDKKDQVRMF